MISFVITARNEPIDILRRTIEELRATTPSRERQIVLVDDGSEKALECLPDDVFLFRNDEPVGVSRARRQGADLASGEVLVWLDAHMTFEPNWLERMLSNVETGSLLCSAFWNYARTTCHCYGADFVWCGERDYHSQRVPGFHLRHRTAFPGTRAADVPMVIGACYMIMRSQYVALGGCSPIYRAWGIDEQDLSARAWLAGFGVKCVTDARVGHLWRPAFPYPVRFEHIEFNQLAFVRSVFEDATAQQLDPFFHPIPVQVRAWLDNAAILDWRAVVQSARQIEDHVFFDAFLPQLTQAP